MATPSDTIERHPLQPFLPPGARLLLLGSFPPPRHRWSMDFFYPNRTNMMWEVFGYVFFRDGQHFVDAERRSFHQQAIEQLLRDKGIAIFDAAQSVVRLQGNASDKFLQVEEHTHLPGLLEQIPLCRHIACTGEKSCQIVCDDYRVAMPRIGQGVELTIAGRRLTLHRLPSTSRAYPLPLQDKARHYEEIFRQAGILS